uniref:Uncharacterized protein n=1 Tax=Aegilops tauschii TaxID=37682 RepID=M8BWR6_AEGTA
MAAARLGPWAGMLCSSMVVALTAAWGLGGGSYRNQGSIPGLQAAFTCKRWRRHVADTAFLARFRSLHAAHVAGHYHVVDRPYREKLPPDGNNQVFVPDPSAADAIDRRHFSLDFLPECDGSSSWELADSRGRRE